MFEAAYRCRGKRLEKASQIGKYNELYDKLFIMTHGGLCRRAAF